MLNTSFAATGITLINLDDPNDPKNSSVISYLNEAAGDGVGTPNSVVFHKWVGLLRCAC